MPKVTSVEDYIRLVEQVRDEISDMLACAEDEGDGESDFMTIQPVLRQIEAGLQQMQEGIKAGTHVIALGEPLSFMGLVTEHRRRLPAAVLAMLDALNLAHKKGFAESESK